MNCQVSNLRTRLYLIAIVNLPDGLGSAMVIYLPMPYNLVLQGVVIRYRKISFFLAEHL
jgi:hypothetical protein